MAAETRGALAALDCGTNSTRLLVAAPDGTTLDREMRITRLGEGVDATHALRSGAIARTVAVLADYRRVMDRHGVERARLVATSAVRDATNAEDFLKAAEDATGVVPEVLSGLEEGALSFAGATAHVPADLLGPGPVLVVDVGGGSTELVAGFPTAGAAGDGQVRVVSMDIGCVRVTERFFHHDPPLATELAAARTVVTATIEAARQRLPEFQPDSALIGLAGTVSTLAALEQGLANYERARLHHFVLTRSAVENWLVRLAGESAADRASESGMVEGRADVIVAGVLVLDVVMATFDRDWCLASEDDILDGLVASLG